MINEGQFVDVHGLAQWVTLRGAKRDNPVVLFMPGPGAGFSPMAPYFASWERDFTVAQWDQPRAGATLAKHGDADTGPYTYDRLARDGIAVTEFICRQVGVKKIVVLGMSAGSIVALKMIRQRPDLFSAYVANGQIVNWARQDALSYEVLLDRARVAKEAATVAELEAIGAPPYPDAATDAIKSKYAGAFTPQEQAALAAGYPAVISNIMSPPPDAHYLAKGVVLTDVRAAAMAAYVAIRSELVAFDARQLGLDFKVPMFFFQGEHDSMTMTSEVRNFMAELRAPKKELVMMKDGGHSSVFLADAFLRLLNQHVRTLLHA